MTSLAEANMMVMIRWWTAASEARESEPLLPLSETRSVHVYALNIRSDKHGTVKAWSYKRYRGTWRAVIGRGVSSRINALHYLFSRQQVSTCIGASCSWVRFNVPPTKHIIGHVRDGFLRVKWPNQQCQNTEWRCSRIRLQPTRSTQSWYSNATCSMTR